MTEERKISASNKWHALVGLNSDIIKQVNKQLGKPLQASAPSKIKAIGSYDLQCGTSPYINIDLCLTMPDTFFDHR